MDTYKIITIQLKSRTAVHIGSGQIGERSDALIRRDSQGKPIIPGTAVAGALRSLITRLAPAFGHKKCIRLTDANSQEECDCPVCELFGNTNPQEKPGSISHASPLLISHATLVEKEIKGSMIRDGVGINRSTGAAAQHIKYDLEILPADSVFNLHIELRDANAQDQQLLAAGLAEWKAGRAWLGGRVSRGLGAFDVVSLEYKIHSLQTAAGLIEFLKNDKPWDLAKLTQVEGKDWLPKQVEGFQSKPRKTDEKEKFVTRAWIKIEGTLQAEGPFLTHDATSAGVAGFDHAPLLVQADNWHKPVLSGASLRGTLRSHAEKIARTLVTHQICEQTADPDQREAQFEAKCPACNPVTRRKDDHLASCDVLLKEANVATDVEIADEQLCLACQLFGSERRGSRLIIEDARYDCSKGEPKYKILDFLAIDRFTGGGADAFKFDALVLWRPAFKVRIFLENPQLWELGWLFLTLRDLQTGWLRVGMGSSKGFGEVQMTDPVITLGYLHETDRDFLNITGQGPRNGSVYQELLINPQQSWVNEFLKKVITVKRIYENNKLSPIEDSYFGHVDSLYPVVMQEDKK